jgi:hypothetical protein
MMNSGKYYVGDLCYVMHDEWNEVCSIIIQDNQVLDGEFNLADGRRFATYGTKWGDGTYRASNGGTISVDAGLIGCIAVDDISEADLPNISLGTIVDFYDIFRTDSDGGIISFGSLTVDTDPEYDEEEDEYYY